MNLVADSFAWPFRGSWRSSWLAGVVVVLFLPLLFVLLLGYAIAATRAAGTDPSQGPPAWRLSRRLIADGVWTALAVLLVALPFIVVFAPFANWLYGSHVWSTGDAGQSGFYARVLAFLILALPLGIALLLVMPNATARFARSGRPRDMFDFAGSLRAVRHDFATWNLAAAAIVTGWAVGVACVGLLCAGIVPGIFYAILVSAHATAALHDNGPSPRAG
ncbi:MAG TPA: DUF4013 domain-containing protein [Candidatus Dormibacteraeota bacterium]|nr:DUF4013 domain-containing protein [Candidatus Dormibacteraeota bacterium]